MGTAEYMELSRRVQIKASGRDIHKVNGILSLYVNMKIFNPPSAAYEAAHRAMRVYIADGDVLAFEKRMRAVYEEARDF
jgi:hypothetical protein